jgi:hypothetical protein
VSPLIGVTNAEGAEAGPVPELFVAVTVKVYGVSASRLETVHDSGPLAHVQVCPPGELVTVYPVIVLPLSAGAAHETVIAPQPRVVATPDGALGTWTGTTATDGFDADPGPTLFVAVTVKVYGVPFASPVTAHDSPPVLVHVSPSDDLTW